MKFNSLLNGLNLGTKQEVGVMSVIPLIGDDVSVEMGSISDLTFEGTHNYGTMVVSNNSDKPVITPSGYSVITKQAAQDHGAPLSHLIKNANKHVHLSYACCIEQTQPGMIRGDSVKSFNLLPLYVRKKHFEQYILSNRNSTDFSRLWGIISEFQRNLVQKSEAHLVYFFNQYMDKLVQFNAEFEIVPKQRGAIILLNNKVIGIEIAPSHQYWKEIWKTLIRDVYGSEVIRLTESNLVEEFKKSQKIELNLDDCDSLEAIEKALQEHGERVKLLASETMDTVLEKEYSPVKGYSSLVKDNTTNDITYSLFSSKDKSSFGELYTSKEEEVLYCSMMFA